YITYLRKHANGGDLERLVTQPPTPLEFWYRQSPRLLVTETGSGGFVNEGDPFSSLPGMFALHLDLDGRLLAINAIPPEREPEPARNGPADWTPLFKAAGIDMASLTPVDPEWTPLAATDARAAWTGQYPNRKD